MEFQRRIPDRAWAKIYEYLQGFLRNREIYCKNEIECRKFVEGVFWMARSGAQWRLLPKEYGKWYIIYKRFAKWSDRGIWYKMLYYFQQDPDMEYIMVDSTILRAHACSAVKKTSKKTKVWEDLAADSRQKSTQFATL